MSTRWVQRLAVTASVLCAASTANAASHLWRFTEFYSSADRRVQFIEMREIMGSEIETNISEHWFATNGFNQDHSQLLGSDLPFGTAFKKFLVGSQSYASLPNVPEPDYVLPDGFLNPAGDTVVWWFYQTIVIPPGEMPTDNYHSITVVDPLIPTYEVTVNSPTNFAGQTGSIPASIVPAVSRTGLAAAALLLAAAAAFALRPGAVGPPRRT
jgi:hypothetical protein